MPNLPQRRVEVRVVRRDVNRVEQSRHVVVDVALVLFVDGVQHPLPVLRVGQHQHQPFLDERLAVLQRAGVRVGDVVHQDSVRHLGHELQHLALAFEHVLGFVRDGGFHARPALVHALLDLGILDEHVPQHGVGAGEAELVVELGDGEVVARGVEEIEHALLFHEDVVRDVAGGFARGVRLRRALSLLRVCGVASSGERSDLGRRIVPGFRASGTDGLTLFSVGGFSADEEGQSYPALGSLGLGHRLEPVRLGGGGRLVPGLGHIYLDLRRGRLDLLELGERRVQRGRLAFAAHGASDQ